MSQIDTAARVAMLVPESTRTNYVDAVRRSAVARGISLEAARSEKVKGWRAQHENDPANGFDVLADWLESADLGASDVVDPAEAAKVRAFETAKRDPSNPQTAILDLSDAQLRGEIDAARNAAADSASALAPIEKPDGTQVPASQIDAALNAAKTPAKPTK